MLQRFKRAFEAGKSAVSDAVGPHVVEDVTTPVSPSLPEPLPAIEPDPFLALLILDEVGPAAPELIRKHLAAAKSLCTRALFIVGPRSEMDFFPDRELLCEYLPSNEDIFRATEERADVIALYRQHRLLLILDKWRVQDCHWVGEDAGELVAQTKANMQRPIRFNKI